MTRILKDAVGTAMPGDFFPARPEGLILIHDVFGLNNQMRGVAQRFAAEGPSTLAIDLFQGRTAMDGAIGAQLAQNLHWRHAVGWVRASVDALTHHGVGTKVAVCGFGFGGAVALAAAAAEIPNLAACVTFYGIPTSQQANLQRITCKVQGHFGTLDRQITQDRVNALETKLTDAGIITDIHRYHTGHFFFDEVRKLTHSPHNAEHSFRRAVAFIKRELGIPWNAGPNLV